MGEERTERQIRNGIDSESCWEGRRYVHYWRPRLCRVFLHSAKSHLHSAKALPSVALGKVRAKFFSTKGLCRVLFIGALGKIKKNCRVLGAALGKIFSAVAAPAVNGYFAEWPTQHSAKFFLITLPSAPAQALGKVFFYFFLKKTFPSALAQALSKVFFYFFKKLLCRVPQPRHSAKFFLIFFKSTLPSALAQALGKVFFIFFK